MGCLVSDLSNVSGDGSGLAFAPVAMIGGLLVGHVGNRVGVLDALVVVFRGGVDTRRKVTTGWKASFIWICERVSG